MTKKEQILRIFPRDLRGVLERMPVDFEMLQELRLRVGKPLMIRCGNREYLVRQDGKLEEGAGNGGRNGTAKGTEEGTVNRAANGTADVAACLTVSLSQMRETVEFMSSFSLYAAEEELRQGFLTVQGGHRIGVGGKTVVQGNEIRLMKFISFLNVRVAHEIRGCADPVIDCLYSDRNQFLNTLIISPPCCGKTTLLRDLIRQISDGNPGKGREGLSVGVVDERSEIGACYQGIPQNDLGMRTDVLDCCPKSQGMMMLVRSMAPAVIAVDEIGSRADAEAAEYARNCGCALAATVHGGSLEEIRGKPDLGELIRSKTFKRLILLDGTGGPGHIKGVWDGDGNVL